MNIIDGVLTPPGNLTETLNETNITAFLTFAQNVTEKSISNTNVSAVDVLGEARGFTLFVPDDQALQQAQQTLQQFQNNQTAQLSILGNYVRPSSPFGDLGEADPPSILGDQWNLPLFSRPLECHELGLKCRLHYGCWGEPLRLVQ